MKRKPDFLISLKRGPRQFPLQIQSSEEWINVRPQGTSQDISPGAIANQSEFLIRFEELFGNVEIKNDFFTV